MERSETGDIAQPLCLVQKSIDSEFPYRAIVKLFFFLLNDDFERGKEKETKWNDLHCANLKFKFYEWHHHQAHPSFHSWNEGKWNLIALRLRAVVIDKWSKFVCVCVGSDVYSKNRRWWSRHPTTFQFVEIKKNLLKLENARKTFAQEIQVRARRQMSLYVEIMQGCIELEVSYESRSLKSRFFYLR